MPISQPADAWTDADQLFRQDLQWRGADAAYSVPLAGERTLWLFGDTFIGPSRSTAQMVHNTIGIQVGSDPSTASLSTHTGPSGSPFFPTTAGSWLWPMAGVSTPAGVVVFFMRVRSARPDLPTVLDAWRAEGSLMFFDVFGWTAVLIRNPDEPVASWDVVGLDTPPAVDWIMPGAGAFCDGGFLYAYGWRDGHSLRAGRVTRRVRYRGYLRPRRAFLLRWPVAEISKGLTSPEWFDGAGWSGDASAAVPVVDSPATEFTVHRDSAGLVMIEASGWLAGFDGVPLLRRLQLLKRLPRVGRLLSRLGLLRVSISMRRAPAPEGPWSDPVRLHTPRVAGDVLVYAGKGHPQLAGGGLVCTYAQIALKADRTLADDALYYPRFLRARR